MTHSTPKLRDLPAADRAAALQLPADDIAALRAGLTLKQADHMIENVIATYALPMGVATNFMINDREFPAIPMVVEESSVVAACSYAAKLTRATGGFIAGSSEPIMIGQIQVLDLPDRAKASAQIEAERDDLIDWLNTRNPSTISKHAKAVGLEIRELKQENPEDTILDSEFWILNSSFLVLHVLYDCADAMGANLINTACEALAPRIAQITGGRIGLRILSNLSDRRLAWARCVIPARALEETGDGGRRTETAPSVRPPSPVISRIVEASLFAEIDPYRAATHNKGVMNGVDAVVIATGNDWRAVEAAAHAYAAREGRYSSLTRWRANEQGDLVGEIKLPMAVGIVGGATRVHPVAQVALRMLGVQTARELAEIIACVGLAQNFAAIRALAMEGIQTGHMALHARQIAIAAGATGAQIDAIAAQLVAEKNVRLERARALVLA